MTLNELERKITSQGYMPTRPEVEHVVANSTTEELVEAAHRITVACAEEHFDMCSIINSKSGRCSENCKWCAQSAHFNTEIETYPLVDMDTVVGEALYNEEKGVERFSMVNSGKRPTDAEIEKICEYVRAIKQKSRISVCVSLGLATAEQMRKLSESGVTRYHCNIETAPSHYDQLCTTHTQEQKFETLQAALDAGMEICSGGIIGMGENESQRIELAFALRRLPIGSIPINILHPIQGTPLGKMQLLSDDEIMRCIAIFRLVHPKAYLRLAGGRARLSEEALMRTLYTGINSAIVGDLLTTIGSKIHEDKARILKAGYTLHPEQINAQ